MKNILKTALALLVVVGFSACSDEDETSLPTVQFDFNTVNSSSTINSGGRVQANTLEFTDGSITLTRVEFEAEVDEVDSVEVEIEQEIVIDFATGETTPDLGILVFPAGTYTEASVELELRDEDNVPSVILNGTFVDSNDEAHPIRFEFNSGETFEVEKTGVVTFDPGASIIAEITFDPTAWFANVSSSMLESAVKDENGVIVISETSNATIFEIAADGLDLATEVEIRQ